MIKQLFIACLLLWQAAASADFTLNVFGVADPVADNIKLAVSTNELEARYKPDVLKTKIAKAMQPFGFYQPSITIDNIQQSGADVLIKPGDPVKITAVNIQVDGQSLADFNQGHGLALEFDVPVGEVLDHQRYEAAKGKLQSALVAQGYLDATFENSRVEVSLRQRSAEVQSYVTAGQRYRFGPLKVAWLDARQLPDGLLLREKNWQVGDAYEPEKLLALRTTLQDKAFVESVSVQYQQDQAVDGVAPVLATVKAAAPRAYNFSVGVGTDTGPRVGAGVHWRWLNDNADSLRIEATSHQFAQTAGAIYDMPLGDSASVQFEAAGKHEVTDDTEQVSWRVAGRYKYRDGAWTYAPSLVARYDRFSVGDEDERAFLLMPTGTMSYLQVDDLQFVQSGLSFALTTRGASTELGSDADIVQAHARVKTVNALADRWRWLNRAEAGITSINDFDQLPPDLRFYAGGDRSVRGYGYQSISPRNNDGDRAGGKHLLSVSTEFEYRFAESWAVAVFTDAGTATNRPELPALGGDDDALRWSAGMGLRWISPIGMVRLDVAAGLRDDDNPVRVHFTLGPDL